MVYIYLYTNLSETSSIHVGEYNVLYYNVHGSYGLKKIGKWQDSYSEDVSFPSLNMSFRNVKSPWKLWFRGMKRIVEGTWFLSEYIPR